MFLSAKHEEVYNQMLQQALAYADSLSMTYEVQQLTENNSKSGVFYDKYMQIDDDDLRYGLRNSKPVAV